MDTQPLASHIDDDGKHIYVVTKTDVLLVDKASRTTKVLHTLPFVTEEQTHLADYPNDITNISALVGIASTIRFATFIRLHNFLGCLLFLSSGHGVLFRPDSGHISVLSKVASEIVSAIPFNARGTEFLVLSQEALSIVKLRDLLVICTTPPGAFQDRVPVACFTNANLHQIDRVSAGRVAGVVFEDNIVAFFRQSAEMDALMFERALELSRSIAEGVIQAERARSNDSEEYVCRCFISEPTLLFLEDDEYLFYLESSIAVSKSLNVSDRELQQSISFSPNNTSTSHATNRRFFLGAPHSVVRVVRLSTNSTMPTAYSQSVSDLSAARRPGSAVLCSCVAGDTPLILSYAILNSSLVCYTNNDRVQVFGITLRKTILENKDDGSAASVIPCTEMFFRQQTSFQPIFRFMLSASRCDGLPSEILSRVSNDLRIYERSMYSSEHEHETRLCQSAIHFFNGLYVSRHTRDYCKTTTISIATMADHEFVSVCHNFSLALLDLDFFSVQSANRLFNVPRSVLLSAAADSGSDSIISWAGADVSEGDIVRPNFASKFNKYIAAVSSAIEQYAKAREPSVQAVASLSSKMAKIVASSKLEAIGLDRAYALSVKDCIEPVPVSGPDCNAAAESSDEGPQNPQGPQGPQGSCPGAQVDDSKALSRLSYLLAHKDVITEDLLHKIRASYVCLWHCYIAEKRTRELRAFDTAEALVRETVLSFLPLTTVVGNRFIILPTKGRGAAGGGSSASSWNTMLSAWDIKKHQLVAAKTLPGNLSGRQFLRVYRQLTHPHLLAYLGNGFTFFNVFYVFTEAPPHYSLSSHFQNSRHVVKMFSSEDNIRVFVRSILKAINFITSDAVKLIHRELRPSHIWLKLNKNMQPEAKIYHIGFMSTLSANEPIEFRTIWAAPEVVCGGISSKSDIWSIGTITFRLLEVLLLLESDAIDDEIRLKPLFTPAFDDIHRIPEFVNGNQKSLQVANNAVIIKQMMSLCSDKKTVGNLGGTRYAPVGADEVDVLMGICKVPDKQRMAYASAVGVLPWERNTPPGILENPAYHLESIFAKAMAAKIISPAAIGFIKSCWTFDVRSRPTAEELLRHRWMRGE